MEPQTVKKSNLSCGVSRLGLQLLDRNPLFAKAILVLIQVLITHVFLSELLRDGLIVPEVRGIHLGTLVR